MRVHAFVLHKTRSEERRDNARALLATCGIDGEVWPAVDADALDGRDLAPAYDSHLYDPAYPFPLDVVEIGRFLSHRQVWAEMQNRALDAALILEDDAMIDPGPYDDALDLALQHIDRLGYIQFPSAPPARPARLIDKLGACALVLPELSGLGTAAQLVDRHAAAALLAQSNPFDRPIDRFVQSHWQTGIRAASVYPSGITTLSSLSSATIPTDQAPGLGRRLQTRLSSLLHDFSVGRHARSSTAPLPHSGLSDEPGSGL